MDFIFTPRAWSVGSAFASLLVFGSSALEATTTDRIHREFTVQPGGTLTMDIDRGRIEIQPGTGNIVSFEITREVSGSSREREEAFLREHEVAFEQDDNDISVRAQRRGGNSWRDFFRRDPKANFHYIVTVPQRFDLELKTAGGGIAIRDMEGKVRARTSGGGLAFSGIKGPIHGRTSGGSIKLADCRGDVDVRTSGGGIDSREGAGGFALTTSGGSIHVQGHRGDLEASTSGGSVTIERVSGSVQANTSGGSIRAQWLAQPAGDCRLQTSGGGITVTVPSNARLALDARTSAGGIDCELPLSGVTEKKRSRLQAEINGGGPRLLLRTSAGGIHVKSGAVSTAMGS